MEKVKSVLPKLWLLSYKALPVLCVCILCLTLASTVFADGGGPQGGSNSGGAPPPPPPPPPNAGLLAWLIWIIQMMLAY